MSGVPQYEMCQHKHHKEQNADIAQTANTSHTEIDKRIAGCHDGPLLAIQIGKRAAAQHQRECHDKSIDAGLCDKETIDGADRQTCQ